MIKSSLFFCLVTVSLITSSAQTTPQEQAQQNMSAQTLSTLIERYRGKPYKNFDRFALDVYITGKRFLTKHQHDAIGEYASNQRLTPQQSFVVHRLLGIYTRLKYGGEARRMLAKLVTIPSHHQEGIEQHKNRNFVRMEKTIASYAKQFGLRYKNIGRRVYEVSLPSSKKGTLIGLHANVDVLPANRDLWILNDGTRLDPFKMTQVGDRLYGRGTQDNKNAIVVAMMAMRIVKEEKIVLFNKVRLLVDTTEKSTADTIPYYLRKNPTPSYNIALNGRYPELEAIGESRNANQRSLWLSNLHEIASENLELPQGFGSSDGETSVRLLPNGVQFTLSQPDPKYTELSNIESKSIDQFLLDLQIVTEMIMRMGLMRNLE